MNTRNQNDQQNQLEFLSYLRPLFYLAVLVLIIGGICVVQCSEPKQVEQPNMRVPYNPLYENTEVKDWSEDSTMTQGKIETLNEIMPTNVLQLCEGRV